VRNSIEGGLCWSGAKHVAIVFSFLFSRHSCYATPLVRSLLSHFPPPTALQDLKGRLRAHRSQLLADPQFNTSHVQSPQEQSISTLTVTSTAMLHAAASIQHLRHSLDTTEACRATECARPLARSWQAPSRVPAEPESARRFAHSTLHCLDFIRVIHSAGSAA
jgi:hypothetical protein